MKFVDSDDIRHQFSQAMSAMYQQEVPLYKALMELVADVNQQTLAKDPKLAAQLRQTGELDRIDLERHGAIRLGLPSELYTIRRLFAVMGMSPVGYYDLAPAGVPVHSTAFRATSSQSLQKSPFRVFCSLLRLELIDDEKLRQQAIDTLHNRQIFSPKTLELIELFEQQGGLTQVQADEFVQEATKTFQWHKTSPVSQAFYEQLHNQHRLIADIVGFFGPHINHLTPRTLDIDAAQDEMTKRGIDAKEVIEGPPRRHCPILLRQTSFKALKEAIYFQDTSNLVAGHHTARFGEIEQRGIALTPKGRQLYDELLAKARQQFGKTPESDPQGYYQVLGRVFADFPDDYQSLYDGQLAYFYYQINDPSKYTGDSDPATLVKTGVLSICPIVYEDFLPVSAAGIFQSNLGDNAKADYSSSANQAALEESLGVAIQDECTLYQQMMDKSLQDCLVQLTN